MHFLGIDAIRLVVAAIQDDQNPRAQAEALTMRDQWLLEADLGTLEMLEEGRRMLESV